MIDLDTWPGDRIDGKPCCLLRGAILSPGLLKMLPDRRGYGIPSHGLPLSLQGFGLNGWRVVDTGGSLTMVRGMYGQQNEAGSRAYLACLAERICKDMEAWKPWVEMMSHE